MATVKAYVRQLWTVQKQVALKLGVDITWGSQEKRVLALSEGVLIAGLIKTLTNKGVITDQELQTVYDAIAAADFPVQPLSVPGMQDGQQAADPDIGA